MAERSFSVGRSRRCDLVVPDKSVSRVHAEFTLFSNGSLKVVDQGSKNGTYTQHNGAWNRVREVLLDLNDTVRLGAVELSVAEVVQNLETVVLANVADVERGSQTKLHHPRRNPATGEIEEG